MMRMTKIKRTVIKGMDMKEIFEKIKKSENVKVYDCGIYAGFDAKILRKYTNEKTPVKLPDNYLLIVLEKDL